MDANFDNPGRLETLSLIVAASFIPLSLISAAIWPVAGLPLWGKGLFTGLFFLGVYASFRKRRLADKKHQEAIDTRQRADPGDPVTELKGTPSATEAASPVGKEKGLSGGDRP